MAINLSAAFRTGSVETTTGLYFKQPRKNLSIRSDSLERRGKSFFFIVFRPLAKLLGHMPWSENPQQTLERKGTRDENGRYDSRCDASGAAGVPPLPPVQECPEG